MTNATTEHRVREAADDLTRRGYRPSIRSVREELQRRHGTGGSFRDIAPALAAWRAKRRGSDRLSRAVGAWKRLDPEERAAFRDMTTEGKL